MAFDYSLGGEAVIPNWSDSSYDIPKTGDTVARDIVSASIPASDTASNDGWTDWFKKLGGAVVDYSIKKDAAQTGASLMVRPQAGAQPTYYSTAAAQNAPLISSKMLLIGAVIAAVLVLNK